MSKKTSMPAIIIDTNEQLPYIFLSIKPVPAVIYHKLETGDYSISGFENQITIERKSMSDLFKSTGNDRDRFEREFERMSLFPYAALVIEGDLSSIFLNPPYPSQMEPKSVYRTLLSWSEKYGVHVWPCPDRVFAEKTTYLLLNFWWRHNQ